MAIRHEVRRIQFLILDWQPASKALRESTNHKAIRFRKKNADLLSEMDEMIRELIAKIKFPKK